MLNQRPMIITLLISSVLLAGISYLVGFKYESLWLEISVFAPAVFVLAIAFFYEKYNHADDEYQQKQVILRIYSIGFTLICMLAVLIYYATMTYDVSSLFLQYGSFVNLLFFLIFLINFMFIRKQKLTLNARFIDFKRKQYTENIMKRIFYLFAFALMTGIICYLLHSDEGNFWIYTEISLALSFLSFSFLYVMISIYERIHYVEKQDEPNGLFRYVSNKVLFLVILISSFALIGLILRIIHDAIYLQLIPYPARLYPIIEMLIKTLTIRGVDLAIVGLIANLILLSSISRQKLYFPSYFGFFRIVIWLGFVYQMALTIYSVSMNFNLLSPLNMPLFSTISILIQNAHIIVVLTALVVNVMVYLFMDRNSLPGSKLFLIKTILVVYPVIRLIIWYASTNSSMEYILHFNFYSGLVSLVFESVSIILSLIILRQLGKPRKIEKQETKEIETDFVLT